MSKGEDLSHLAVAQKQHEDQKSAIYAGILFFIWPLLSVILALKDYRSRWGKNILWAFIAFYGFSFAIGAESQNSDIVRYIAEVEYLHGIQMTFGDAIDYYRQSQEIDLLRTFIAVTVSRATDSQAVLTLIYGIIFGFFYSRNMWFVLDRLRGKIQPITILLLVCFFLIIPVWNITTFRMWTAAHIFVYGLLPFLFDGKKSGIVVATLAVLVHYVFVIPVGVLYVYLLFGNRMMIYFIFFLATFFISEINISAFNNIIESYAPEIVQERTVGYRGEDKVQEFRSGETDQGVWYAVWYGRALRWAVMGFLIVLFLKGRDFFNKNKPWANLLSFILLFYGVANIFSSLPSGGRFIAIANLCAIALIILYVQNRDHDEVLQRFVLFATPALLLFVVVAVRTGLYSISATFFLGNPIIAVLFGSDNISLNDVLKMII